MSLGFLVPDLQQGLVGNRAVPLVGNAPVEDAETAVSRLEIGKVANPFKGKVPSGVLPQDLLGGAAKAVADNPTLAVVTGINTGKQTVQFGQTGILGHGKAVAGHGSQDGTGFRGGPE